MTDNALHLRFRMHLRATDGHTYGYELTRGQDGPVVGHKSVYSPSARAVAKGEKGRAVYTLGDKEFVDDPKGLLAAYEQMLRDEEWAAAAPKAQRMSNFGCRHCDGNGWLTTGRIADTSSGGFTCDIMMPEIVRCPARCESGVLVLATEIGARAQKYAASAPKETTAKSGEKA